MLFFHYDSAVRQMRPCFLCYLFCLLVCLSQGMAVNDMQEEEWAELMKVVTEDMQGVPQTGAGGVFPLPPSGERLSLIHI